MDLLIIVLGVIWLLFFVPAILSQDIDTFDGKDDPAPKGRPSRCDTHMWRYNEQKRLQCMRCGKFPHGDN